jgi:hypothetical protein
MVTLLNQPVPRLSNLPATLPRQGAIEIELEQGALIFRISPVAQSRIEDLLDKQRAAQLTSAEEQELQQYEDIDDYLSYLNRLVRNLSQREQKTDSAS